MQLSSINPITSLSHDGDFMTLSMYSKSQSTSVGSSNFLTS